MASMFLDVDIDMQCSKITKRILCNKTLEYWPWPFSIVDAIWWSWKHKVDVLKIGIKRISIAGNLLELRRFVVGTE